MEFTTAVTGRAAVWLRWEVAVSDAVDKCRSLSCVEKPRFMTKTTPPPQLTQEQSSWGSSPPDVSSGVPDWRDMGFTLQLTCISSVYSELVLISKKKY